IEGFKSSFLPSFGIEIQNGKVGAEVIISDSEIHNKFVSNPDYILLFHPSRIKDAEKIASGSTIILCKDFTCDSKNNFKEINTESLLEVVSKPMLSNVAFLSYFIKELSIFSDKSVSESIKQIMVNKQYNLSVQNFKLYQKIIKGA
ncbi:MAG: 2-oxoacid:acceptor oxidoreductase family protein, partial [Candidatus Sericytochromatia bacterium]